MRVVIPVLDRFATKPLRVVDEDIEVLLGPSSPESTASGLSNAVPDFRINHPAVWRSIGKGGIGSLGSTYEDGWWTTEDLPGVLTFFLSLMSVLPAPPNIDPITRRIRSPREQWEGIGHDDPIVQGYILDKTMFHGTGRFLTLPPQPTHASEPERSTANDLYSASLARFSQICERLELDGNSRLCEIGTGWGAFALYAARTRGCSVVTVTDSEVGATFAKKRLANAGLTDSVQVKVGAPTAVDGTFDAVVSLDADVWGRSNLPTVDIDRLLDVDGLALVQTNVLENSSVDRSFLTPSQRPTLGAITGSLASTGVRLVATTELVEDQRQTLAARRANLVANQGELERAGFGGAVFRSRQFCLVRDQVLAEEFGTRAMQLILA